MAWLSIWSTSFLMMGSGVRNLSCGTNNFSYLWYLSARFIGAAADLSPLCRHVAGISVPELASSRHRLSGRSVSPAAAMKRQRQRRPSKRVWAPAARPTFFAARMTSLPESPRMAIGPLKVLRKAAEPPASGLRRIPKTLKQTNHLRRRDGRALILPSVVGTLRPGALNSEPAKWPFERAAECGLSSHRHIFIRAPCRSPRRPPVTRGTGGDSPSPKIFYTPLENRAHFRNSLVGEAQSVVLFPCEMPYSTEGAHDPSFPVNGRFTFGGVGERSRGRRNGTTAGLRMQTSAGERSRGRRNGTTDKLSIQATAGERSLGRGNRCDIARLLVPATASDRLRGRK